MSAGKVVVGNSIAGATFSTCRRYRYTLWRNWAWDGNASVCAFLMLNPSTADEHELDPTLRRCRSFAQSWGFGGMLILNLFAFRATEPSDMKAATDPVGAGNDEELCYQRSRCGLMVAGWGVHGSHLGRDEHVRKLLCKQLFCLGLTKDGHPRHPLYVAAAQELVNYYSPEQ